MPRKKKRMIRKKNAQAFDNLALLGLILFVAIGVFYLASEQTDTKAIYLSDALSTVDKTVESLSNLGDGSADTIVVRTPGDIQSANLIDCDTAPPFMHCDAIEVTYGDGSADKFEMNYPVWGSLGFLFIPGTHFVTMINDGDNQQIVFQECGDGLVSGSEQCEPCQDDNDCDGQFSNGARCWKEVGNEWGYCGYGTNGLIGGCMAGNGCKPVGDEYACYCECTDDDQCPSGNCLPDGVCGGCESNLDCGVGEYCGTGNCQECDKDLDLYEGAWNSVCSGVDCNDNDALINPGIEEGVNNVGTCTDGIDNNCNGLVDCDEAACSTEPACAGGTCTGGSPNGVCEVDENCIGCSEDCGNCCPTSMIDYWRLEEGTGTTSTSDNGLVADFVTYPNVNTQEIKWDIYSHSQPMLGQWAVWFDETNIDAGDDMLRIDTGIDLNTYTGGTLEFVFDAVNGENIPGRGIFKTCNGKLFCNDLNGMRMFFDDQGIIYVEITKDLDRVIVDDNGACKASNYQCYIAVTWEENQPLKIHVNNALAGSSIDSVLGTHFTVLDPPYIFGMDIQPLGVGANSFIGELHQFVFYDKALSDTEVLDNFNIYYGANPTDPFAGFLCGSGAQCGNNQVEWPEECDDGNLVSGDGCDSACKNENVQVCGDGFVDAPEECDDGSHCSDGTECTSDPGVCSLGVDDCQPRTGIGGSCDATCNWEEVCGDGIVVGNEECDEGINNGPNGICSLTCTYNDLQCTWLNNYWRFEEEVNPALYDANNGKVGSIGTAVRVNSANESESIGFWEVDDTAILSITDMIDKGTIYFWINPGMISSLGTRVITHESLTVDLMDVPGSLIGEKYLDVWFGKPGSLQNIQSAYYLGQNAIMADGGWTLVGVSWDAVNFYVYYNDYIYGPQVNSVAMTNVPMGLDISLTLGYDSISSSGSFVGNIDEFATFSERLDEWNGGAVFHDQTFLRMEGSAFCGKKVCGDDIITGKNSLGVNEQCDDHLLFGTGGCSDPGTIVASDLLDCQYMNGAGGGGGGSPYCGNGVLEAGEVCDPPGSRGSPQTFSCSTGPITVEGVCQEDCSQWVYADPCDTNPPGPYCGDGVLDPGERCEPPGSLGAPFHYICPNGHSFWVWGVCTSACDWAYPPILCDDGEPKCPPEPPANPACSAPNHLCYTINCEAGNYDLYSSRQCQEPTPNAHWRCDEAKIEVRCDGECQCPTVTPNSCSQFCRIVCS